MRTTGRTVLLALAASAAISAVALFFIFRFLLPARTQGAAPAAYTIGVWEGQVAVFERDDPYPMQILDTPVAGLPAEARTRLKDGVRVERAEELYMILEDYTG